VNLHHLFIVNISAVKPQELPVPFDGQRQYSHQVHTAPTAADSFGGVLTPCGSGKFVVQMVYWTCNLNHGCLLENDRFMIFDRCPMTDVAMAISADTDADVAYLDHLVTHNS